MNISFNIKLTFLFISDYDKTTLLLLIVR